MLKHVLAISLTVAMASGAYAAVAAPKTKAYSPKGYSVGRCTEDPKAPKAAQKIQDYLTSRGRCVGPMYVAKTAMTTKKPTTAISATQDQLSLEKCKVKQPAGMNEYRGFPVEGDKLYSTEKHPAPGTVIQVVGLKSPDSAAPKNKPSVDYKIYLDFLKNWFANINNSTSPVQIRVLDQYVDFGENFAPFQISHGESPENKKTEFATKVANVLDPLIDFTSVNYVLAFVPAGTSPSVISQDGFSGIKVGEGANQAFSVAPPALASKNEFYKFANFYSPLMWIHEMYHPGFNLGDSIGESIFTRTNPGMGEWGMMASGSTDLLQWQKWLLGFTTDTQVVCVDPVKGGTYWLAPGSTKTSKQKMAVIPISDTEVVIIESVRATGANFKLNTEELGALVYTLKTTETEKHQAYLVQFPDTRVWKPGYRNMMSEAPLRRGDSVTVKGVKITNVEWGDFGDVIKVEPAN